MKKIYSVLCAAAISGAIFTSCSDTEEFRNPNMPSSEELSAIESAGFSINGAFKSDDGSLWIENDINLTLEQLKGMKPGSIVNEQYSTDNLVLTNGSRLVTMYAPEGGNTGYSPGMIAGLDEAIARYNAQNLEISFQRITTDNADIRMTRLKKGDERRGILGSAGFPTAAGDPHNEIKMSGILESTYNLSTAGIATIIAHEMGHCVGFRHTDFFDRSISCGGSPSNEGASTVGANHIPGTPTGANPSTDLSFMLSCTDGGDRPFTGNDQIALDFLY